MKSWLSNLFLKRAGVEEQASTPEQLEDTPGQTEVSTTDLENTLQSLRREIGARDQAIRNLERELERLRARQEELESERRLLEEMRQKQEAFDTGRRELKDRLQASLAQMDKERLQAERLAHRPVEPRAGIGRFRPGAVLARAQHPHVALLATRRAGWKSTCAYAPYLAIGAMLALWAGLGGS